MSLVIGSAATALLLMICACDREVSECPERRFPVHRYVGAAIEGTTDDDASEFVAIEPDEAIIEIDAIEPEAASGWFELFFDDVRIVGTFAYQAPRRSPPGFVHGGRFAGAGPDGIQVVMRQ